MTNQIEKTTKTAQLTVAVFQSVTKRITFPELIARIQAIESCEQKQAVNKAWAMLAFGYVEKDSSKTYAPTFNPDLIQSLENPGAKAIEEAAKKTVKAKKKTKAQPEPEAPKNDPKRVYVNDASVEMVKRGVAAAVLCSNKLNTGDIIELNGQLIVRVKSCGKIAFFDSETGPEVLAVACRRVFTPESVTAAANALGFESPEDFRASMESGLQPCWPYVGFICEVSKETT